MSARSIRRAHAQRLAKEGRRDALRRRRAGIFAGAVLGATALGATTAQAATYTVTGTTDGAVAACTGTGPFTCTKLRDAVAAANAASGDDTINFGAGVTGTIKLTGAGGALSIAPTTNGDKLTITGPGASTLTISGDKDNSGTPNTGDPEIFTIPAAANESGPVSISGLTLTNGYGATTGAGAVNEVDDTSLTLTDVTITNSKTDVTATNLGGGAIFAAGDLTLTNTTISGNTAPTGHGGAIYSGGEAADLTITNSTISGNTAQNGGGIFADDSMTLSGSTVSGNTGTAEGGGIDFHGKYNMGVSSSVISGNTSPNGGGLFIRASSDKYTAATLLDTTVSGNHGSRGAGVQVGTVDRGNRVIVNRSTISGNDGGASSFGGGLLVYGPVSGAVDVLNSTISGNTATTGAGVSLGSDGNNPLLGTYNGSPSGSVDFDNSTIASNAATGTGGGIYLSQYDSGSPAVKKSGNAGISSTIVADNTAAGLPQDLDRVNTSTSGGFAGAFSLIEQPGDAPLTKQATTTGIDPQLGALANNGGSTFTELPAGTSPVLDQGRAPLKLAVDQRGQPRTVDTGLPNAPAGGDGTDIGAVELPAASVVIPPGPAAPSLLVGIRGSLIGTPPPPLLAAGSTSVVCAISTGAMTSCVIELRALSATKERAKTVAAGALLGSGEVTSAGASSLSTKITLNGTGKALLKSRPLGLDMGVFAVASGSSSPSTIGKAHVLSGPSITLKLGTRKISKGVLAQVDQAAALLKGAKTITCTGYAGHGKHNGAIATSQAKAACARIVKDGFKGKTTARRSVSTHRRLVLTFGF